MEKLKLSPVEALVFRWSSKSLSNTLLRNFMSHLDLSNGNELYDRCSDICIWYEEVILNGKHFFNSYLDKFLKNSDKEHLVVILTAGKSTLPLELCLNHLEKINHILEIDRFGMETKKELYDKYYPQFTEKIKCINADISSDGILDAISDLLKEYYQDLPLIVVMESAVFFLSKEDLQKITQSFRSTNLQNTVMVEYLIPPVDVASESREINNTIFDCINEYSEFPDINPYTKSEIEDLFSLNGGVRISNCDMKTMEKNRLGENIYFNNPAEGWLECGVWKI
ncbi:MAG: hypothetical protein SCALA702_03230 [Melioribacteraceae bacterium]|nr:MAG: hypothetical protein SCALA702_03230 [Melioribacteraceae bacterium]